jgi:hypothetical protein
MSRTLSISIRFIRKSTPVMKHIFLMMYLISSVANLIAQNSIAPPARYSTALTFDENRGKLVLFGGYYKGSLYGDTWEWDGEKWEMKSQSGPSPRNAPAIVYHVKRKTTILFGGDERGKALADTWEWNGTEWKQLSTNAPPVRSLHTLAYDPKRDRVVLFGGMDNGNLLNDLWEWDGTIWKQIQTTAGPDARFLHASTNDAGKMKVIIYGGNTVMGPTTAESIRGDLWGWDGTQWELLAKSGPAPRDHAGIVYDPLKKKLILHGGGVPSGNIGDTWEWDGGSWKKLSETSNAPQAGYKLIYDSKQSRVLLYGGFVGGGASSSLWEWSGEWKEIKR